MWLLWLAACGPGAPPEHALDGEALGTTFSVRWLGDVTEDDVADDVRAALDEVDAHMSTWRDDSDLSVARRAGGPVPVAAETALVIGRALELSRDTGGAFDPTVEPLMELWGLHGTPRDTLPTDGEVAAALALLGPDRVVIGPGPTVDTGGTALDLSAIAKGWAVDRVSYVLAAHGAADHMVEIGGEVRAHGHGPTGGPWRVGVEVPARDAPVGAAYADVVLLTDAAVATSGNYRSHLVIAGTEVWHTMDPRTGRPATARVLSSTVRAPDCATADGWATALMVLGEAGLPLIEARPDLEALLIVPDGDGTATRATSGMGRFLQSTHDGS